MQMCPQSDRIDMHVFVPRVEFHDLQDIDNAETSKVIKQRIVNARQRQKDRFKGNSSVTNSAMNKKEIKKYINLLPSAQQLLKDAFNKLSLSARAYDRLLKVALTIADLGGEDKISEEHLAEALQYRNLDKIYNEL